MEIVILVVVIWLLWLITRAIRKRWNETSDGGSKMLEKTILFSSDDEIEGNIMSHESEEDGLVTVTIGMVTQSKSEALEDRDDIAASVCLQQKSQGKDYLEESNRCWVPKGKSIRVAGTVITNGMVYVGGQLQVPGSYYGEVDNCLINPALKVAKNSHGVTGDDMPYWPQYSGISPGNRKKYLEWLSDGAKDAEASIGYVFLYFYGLERRLFYDQSLEDAVDIISEIKRLLTLYGNSRSVSSYFNSALSLSNLLLHENLTVPPAIAPERYGWEVPLDVRLYLGNKLQSDPTLHSDDLSLWLLKYPDTRLRTPAFRLEKQFVALIRLRLAEKYPKGLKVRVPKKKISPEYSASSGTFTADLSRFLGDVPDIGGLKPPLKQAQQLVDDALKDLDKLSRYMGRTPSAEGTLKAASLLPSELVNEYGGDAVQSLYAWLRDQHRSSGGIAPLATLIAKATNNTGTKIPKAVFKEAHSLVTALGWNIIPAPIELIGTAKPDMKILIIPADRGGMPFQYPSPKFLLAIFELTLGCCIARADDSFLETEMIQLSKRVETSNQLSADEKARLHHYVQWLTIQAVDFAAIRRKLKTVDEAAKETIATLAISIAAADGQIVPKEVQTLEAIYQSMGLEKQALFSALHAIEASVDQDQKMQGTWSKPLESRKHKVGNKPIRLDPERIAEILHDTARASTLLAEIFREESTQPEEVAVASDDETHESISAYEGLDRAHAQLLDLLLERDEWPRDDYERLATNLHLMPNGAMETINEWSFEVHDEAILEDDNPLTINADLLSVGR